MEWTVCYSKCRPRTSSATNTGIMRALIRNGASLLHPRHTASAHYQDPQGHTCVINREAREYMSLKAPETLLASRSKTGI